MAYILYLPFGLLPSIIWLSFYLKKDAHPESKKMILKIFFYGMIAAVIAAVIEIGIIALIEWLKGFTPSDLGYVSFLSFLFYHIVVIALVEEISKLLIVKRGVVNNPEFDEPLDAMLYMIIAALGFAALENLLYLSPLLFPSWFPEEGLLSLTDAALVTGFRFIGATFLHALASGIIGYFLALSILKPKRGLLFYGILTASILHGLFNISIIGIGVGAETNNSLLAYSSALFLFVMIAVSSFLVSLGFKRLKKIKSICEIK